MKTFMITTVAALALSTAAYAGNNNGPKFGGSSSATAIAGASASAGASVRNSNTNVNTQGQLQGQSQSISGNNSSVNIRDRKQAPAHAAPSMSSGHPCAYGTSFGVSFVGGAVSGGGNKVDNACLLAQMGYGDAAMAMIAARDKGAYDALERAGYIAPAAAAPVASSRSVTRPVAAPSFTSCKMDDGAIRVGVKRGASDAVKARAVSDCRAALK